MDKKSVELAQSASAEFANSISPLYAQIRQNFLSELAIQGARLDGQTLVETQGAANHRLMSRFVDLLPKVRNLSSYGDSYVLTTDKPFEAQAIRATTLWVETRNIYARYRSPYYVVGLNSDGAAMLVGPKAAKNQNEHPKSRGIFILGLSQSESRRLVAQGQLIYTNPDQTEIEDMFNMAHDRLEVAESTPGVMHANSSLLGRITVNDRTSRMQEVSWVSDNQLFEFNTLDYLSNLSVLFEKERELGALLAEASVD